jgi:predicted component of type VI protein secretion system
MSSSKDFFLEFPAGSDVFNEGETGTETYIVETGQIDLVTADGDPIATLGPGEFFGEAALGEKPHAMSARTSVKTRVLRIERAAFGDVIKQNPEIAVRVLKQVVARLSNARVAAPKIPAVAKPVEQPKPVAQPVVSAPVAPPPAPAAPAPAPAPPPPPPAPKQKMLALRPAGQDQVIPLDAARNEFLIGRPDPAAGINPEIDLGPFNANGTLSRRHARIMREGSLYFLQEENGVANGTHLNGDRLQAGVKVPIKPGDKLRFGLIEVDLISV